DRGGDRAAARDAKPPRPARRRLIGGATPSTMLRMVPLPRRFAAREEKRSRRELILPRAAGEGTGRRPVEGAAPATGRGLAAAWQAKQSCSKPRSAPPRRSGSLR